MDNFEAELLRKAREGDLSAAPFLVSCYAERLLGYARAHAPDLSDADREQIAELAIEAGVRAIRRFDHTKGTLLSWFRGQVRYQTLGWRRTHPATGQLDDDLVDREEPVELTSNAASALRAALSRLPHDDQVILALRDAEHLAYSEIAQRLDITADAARQRHKRALVKLEAEFRKDASLDFIEPEVKG